MFAVKTMTVVESYCTFFQFDCCGGKTYSDYAGSKFQNDTKAEGLQVSTAKALCEVGVARKGDSRAKYSIVPKIEATKNLHAPVKVDGSTGNSFEFLPAETKFWPR